MEKKTIANLKQLMFVSLAALAHEYSCTLQVVYTFPPALALPVKEGEVVLVKEKDVSATRAPRV